MICVLFPYAPSVTQATLIRLLSALRFSDEARAKAEARRRKEASRKVPAFAAIRRAAAPDPYAKGQLRA